MPSSLIRASSGDRLSRRLSSATIAILTAGFGITLLVCRLRLCKGGSETIIITLLSLLAAGLLIWLAGDAARRRNLHETIEIFAGFVGRFEREKATMAKFEARGADERFCHRIIEASDEPCLWLDPRGRVGFGNAAAARMLGRDRVALHGCELVSLLPESARADFRAGLETLAAGVGTLCQELPFHDPDGRTVCWQWRGHALHDERGAVSGLHIAACNLTAQKELETRLLHAQQLQTLGVLTDGVARDLHSLLNPLPDALEMLQLQRFETDDRRLLQAAGRRIRQATALVTQLLGLSHVAADERTHVDMAGVIDKLGILTAGFFASDIEFAVRIEPELRAVHANAAQLLQVLLNLCVNARDAMPCGGVLTLAARNVRFDNAVAPPPANGRSGPHVEIAVSDTGSGLPPALFERIFEPVFTTNRDGESLGLGLSLSRDIVRAHGGFIRAQSSPGEGATFFVYLPAGDRPTPSFPAAGDAAAGQESEARRS